MQESLFSQVLTPKGDVMQTTSSPLNNPPHSSEFTLDPQLVKIVPQLETYEPDSLDTSLVIANSSTIESSEESIAVSDSPPPRPPFKPGEQGTAIYEEIGNPEITSVVNDHLQKHRSDASSNLCEQQLLTKNSASMKSIHYAAADGNNRALGEILSQLPQTVVAAETIIGREWICRRQGIDERDSEGRTALMHAVQNHHSQCVKLLVDAGANVNAVANGTVYVY